MASELIVKTSYGPVQGRHRVGLNGVKYVSFQGIPYARPPIGALRFKAPERPEPWTNVFDATVEGPCCHAQIMDEFANMPFTYDEDCLRVNVFKNNQNFNSKVPVMVFIHGGGFVFGSSNEFANGPEVIMQRDVIMVSMNYRIGLLGFMSISDPTYDIPGNAGLKDQSLALRWVVENIAHFGGDPENITIFGISAGGASVHYHLISEYSKGLFHKAIVQSGSAQNAWANRSAENDLNERLAKNLGWNGVGGNKAIWDLILSTGTEELIQKQPMPTELEKQIGLVFNYIPVVEPYDSGDCFVPMSLVEMNRTAWGKEIPLIIGGTSDEGYLFFNEYEKNAELFSGDGQFENALPKELNLPFNCTERRALGNKLKQHYYGEEKPSMTNLKVFASMLNEKLFWHGINSIVKARVADSKSAPTYLYRFNFSSALLPVLHLWMAGRFIENTTMHGEDMVYLMNPFNTLAALKGDSFEWNIVENMLSLWTSFAATGKPISEATKSAEWEPLPHAVMPFKCLNIARESKIIELPNADHIAFWDTLYDL